MLKSNEVLTLNEEQHKALSEVAKLLLQLDGGDYLTDAGEIIDYDKLSVATDVILSLADAVQVIAK